MTTIACYNFNNPLEGATVYDETGNHNGSIVGSIPLVDGPIGSKARRFPGVINNCIVIPHHVDFTSANSKSYEIWFSTPSSLSASYRFLIMKMPNSGLPAQVGFHLVSGDPSQMYFYVRDSYNNIALATSPAGIVIANSLHYMVGTWNAATRTCLLYSNGVLVAQATNGLIDLGQVDCSDNLTIGGTAWAYSDNPWNSLIHAVRISDVVKTAKEIYDTYNASNIQERV